MIASSLTLVAAMLLGPSVASPPAELTAELAALPDCADEDCPAFKALVARGPAVWEGLEPIVDSTRESAAKAPELTRFWSIGVCAELKLTPCAAPLQRILAVGAAPRLRAASAFALAEILGEAAADSLLLALDDGDVNVRLEAVSGIARLRLSGDAARKGLIGALRDRDADVRRAAIEALGLGGHVAAVPQLIERLRREALPMNRGFAAIALGQLRASAAVGDLVARLDKEADLEALKASIWALGAIGDASASGPLKPLVGHADAEVAELAKATLAHLSKVPELTPRKAPARHPGGADR